MNTKSIIIGAVAVIVAIVVAISYDKPAVVNVTTPAPVVTTQTLGGTPGGDFYTPVNFYQGFTNSTTFATTSTGAGTITATNIANVATILSTNAGALTLTMPASSTLSSFVPRIGDNRQITIVNQGTANLTIAGGVGTLMKVATSSGSTLVVPVGGQARLDFVRKTNTDINVGMYITQ